MNAHETLLPLHREAHGRYALIPTDDGEPTLLLTLRTAGDMQCGEEGGEEGCRNRRALLAELGVPDAEVLTLRQVHSRRVVWTDEIAAPDETGDGLMTTTKGDLPGVTVADCMPIFLFAAGTALRGVVHSGWKGTGIAAEAIRRAGERLDIPPQDISAVLGPSIGPCCYKVDEERAAEFSRLWGADAVQWHDGEPYLDLAAANLSLLRKAGVQDLRRVTECTVCGREYGSFRREGPENFTHMLAMIADFPVD